MARNPFRRQPAPSPSLTAAATLVDLSDESIIKHVLKHRQKWQTQAFEAYDACGELKYGVNFLASLISRLTLFVATHDATDPESEPTAVTDTAITDQFARLGTVVERSELQRELAIQLLVPGEGYLVGIAPGTDPWRPQVETWEMRSIDEVVESGDSIVIISSPNDESPIRLTRAAGDTFIRIHRQHPRYQDLADSHVRPILSVIEELLWVDSGFTAIAKNRLVTAGVFEVPQSMEAPATNPEEAKMTGSQRLAKRLWEAALRAIQNPAAAEAAVPIFVTYPDNDMRKSGMNHNKIERPQDDAMLARNEYLLRRIAQGLNLPVEIVFGLGQATHWGGGQVEESVFREHVEPLVLLIVSALTTAWLRPILEQMPGVTNPEQYLIWYDNSNLIVHPKKEEAADKGYEYGLISGKAWRKVRGFSETDEPTEEEKAEQLEWLKAMRGKDPQPSPDEESNPNETPTQPDGPGERAPEDDGTTGPMKGKGQDILKSSAATNGNGNHWGDRVDLGRALADIDHDLLTRLQVMSHEKVARARERAGNKLKNRAKRIPEHREPLRNIAPEDVARTLGPSTVAAIGGDDLFADAFTAVPAMFQKWCMQAVEAVTKLVPQYTMTAESRTRIERNISRAAATFRDDLENLSASLLYNVPADQPTPEDADLLVPAALVRKSLAIAGGAADPSDRTLLLATGHSFHKELATCGHFPTAYRWSYGSRLRAPFSAHQELDGSTFSLSNSPIKPGDGSSECLCLAIPVYNGAS